MSRTFLATLHYDGTGFVGWQRQPAGRSVQAEFERVLERIFSRRTVAHAAGRTDAGVHASGQAVSFGAPEGWTRQALQRALNALLPKDCWVEAVYSMRPEFHARKSAQTRRYRYDVGLDQSSASPFRRPYEWSLGRALNFDLIQAVFIHGLAGVALLGLTAALWSYLAAGDTTVPRRVMLVAGVLARSFPSCRSRS